MQPVELHWRSVYCNIDYVFIEKGKVKTVKCLPINNLYYIYAYIYHITLSACVDI